jgi:sugar phosphate isomerase/epimerase
MKPRIALQDYTVRDYMKSASDIAATLAKVAAIGYTCIEDCFYGSIGAAEMRKICDGVGLTIVSTHTGFQPMQDELAKVVDDHNTLGAKFAGIGGMPGEFRTSAEGFANFGKLAEKVARSLAAEGLTFFYHNHSFELAKFNGEVGLDVLYANCDGAYVKTELDLYWVQHGGGSPVSWLKKMAGRTPLVHFKDMLITLEMQQQFAEVGEGNLEWGEIIPICEANGVQYAIVEQDTCQRDPLESIKISYNNLRAMGLE